MQGIIIINSLHVPNNHLHMPTTWFSRWHFAAQRQKMYRENLLLHTLALNNHTFISQSIHAQMMISVFLKLFRNVKITHTLSLSFHFHAGLHSVEASAHTPCVPSRTCQGKKSKAALRLGDTLRFRDVKYSEILTSQWKNVMA